MRQALWASTRLFASADDGGNEKTVTLPGFGIWDSGFAITIFCSRASGLAAF
jgi:hypothetical protein